MFQNLKKGIAVRGFDLVEIDNKSKAIKGKSNIIFQYKNAQYHFTTEDNKNTFSLNPDKYIPQYGGYCAIGISEGALVDANPKSFLIQDDQLLLFFSKYLGIINTKRQWVVNPEKKKILGDIEWSKLTKIDSTN
jgi:YHS domain-containing protein